MSDADDTCGEGDDDHTVFVKIEYDITEDEEGRVNANSAAIRSHIHNVPAQVAAGTLILAAHKILSDHMAHTTFEDIADHGLAHAMAHAAAVAFIVQGTKEIPMDLEAISIDVPDDISALLEGEQ